MSLDHLVALLSRRAAIALAPLAAVAAIDASALAAELKVTSTSPARHALAAPRSGGVAVTFDRALDPASVAGNVAVWGARSGVPAGGFSLADAGLTLVFTPRSPLHAGELVTVTISHDLAALDGSFMRPAGYQWQFWTATAAAGLDFTLAQTLDLAGPAPGESPRPYGGSATDFDGDGWVDMAIACEDSSDVRVLLNSGDGSGGFLPYLLPTTPADGTPSPNESADYNGDGLADLATTNTSGNTISVLLGGGDGAFVSSIDYGVGSNPAGMALLDCNGDGAIDVANSNVSSGNVSLVVNSGAGSFSAPSFFDGMGSGEYALHSADMNNDGILDLIVGARFSQTVIVHLCNGNGTFTAMPAVSAGGGPWMLVCGDVNGDGNMDVTTANNPSNDGSILLGNGAGGLGPATTYDLPGTGVATDVGDLDGDGDLDWVHSSFGGEAWTVLINDGTGDFSVLEVFEAPSNPACAIILDVENDGDLDLALIDEIADVIQVFANGTVLVGDLDGDGAIDGADLGAMLGAWGGCEGCAECPADLDGDCFVGGADLGVLLGGWTG